MNSIVWAEDFRAVPQCNHYPMYLHCFHSRQEVTVSGQKDRTLNLMCCRQLNHVNA